VDRLLQPAVLLTSSATGSPPQPQQQQPQQEQQQQQPEVQQKQQTVTDGSVAVGDQVYAEQVMLPSDEQAAATDGWLIVCAGVSGQQHWRTRASG